jgi:hypothetical protein
MKSRRLIEQSFRTRIRTYHSLDHKVTPSRHNRMGVLDFRFGSKSDMAASICNVRFTAESGRQSDIVECPLSAIGRHSELKLLEAD